MLKVILMGLFILGACSSKEDLQVKQAGLYFGAGTQNLMSKDYTSALKSLLKANELDPQNADILNNLAMAYYFKGEKILAVKHLEESLRIRPDNSDAKVNLASLAYKDGDYRKAEKLYKEVKADLTYDKQARTLYNLGMLEMEKKKNLKAAENYLKMSLKEDENYCPAYFQLGMLYYGRRQFNLALKNFKEASVGTCYNAPASHYYQGVTFMELGKYEEARIKFDEIDTRFKKSVFAVKARTKAIELNDVEVRNKNQGHAFKSTVLESPDF